MDVCRCAPAEAGARDFVRPARGGNSGRLPVMLAAAVPLNERAAIGCAA